MSRSSDLDRLIDRYLGIPVLFVLGMVKRKRALPTAPKRIGIIQPTAIGDMFLITGLLNHLRNCWPEAEIHLFHGPSNAAAISLMPVDVIPHCCKFKMPWQVLGELRGARLDLLINCAPWTRLTAIVAAFSDAGATLGFRSPGQHAHYAYDEAVDYAPNRHEVENHRALAQCFGPLDRYRLAVRPGNRTELTNLPFEKTVLLHMTAGGSRARQKSWPASNWAALAQLLAKDGWIVGFTGTVVDISAVQEVIAEAKLQPEIGICLAGRLSLSQLAYVLPRVRLLVTIDTGIAHLASAVNGAVIGLHGPTRFERWGSCNARASGLNAPHPSGGYIHYGFERHPRGEEIMASLSVDEVFSAVLGRLQVPVKSAADEIS